MITRGGRRPSGQDSGRLGGLGGLGDEFTDAVAFLRSASPASGWRLTVLAFGLAVLTAVLIAGSAVTAGWLATRLAVAGVVVISLALTFGSTSLVGLATIPVLAGATIGLDRPEGHAWGQTLLIGLLWYVTAEVAWASIEAREATVRSPAVNHLRIREVSTVVAVALVVGLGATVLAAAAPTRTVVVRVLVIAAVLGCVVGLGRNLLNRSRAESGPDADSEPDSDSEPEPGDQRP